MLLKLIAFAAAVIPVILFLRSILGRRPTKLGATMREAKKQVDFAIYLFIGLMGCVVAFAAGKLAWTWWTSL
jgi:multisubunit Na+/H+ antiporter MnhB subunit